MRVIGIDPSLKNTAIALVQEHLGIEGLLQINTVHIEELEIGGYTDLIRKFMLKAVNNGGNDGLIQNYHDIHDDPIVCGSVEDFSNAIGGKLDKNSIATVNHSGGMAEEALYAAGIPIQPLTVRQWRNAALGKAPSHPTKTGRMMSYWTKGDTAYKVPDNLTPALLRLFNKHLKLSEKANYSQLIYGKLKQKYNTVHTFDEALRFIEIAGPLTSRRIQLVFGISLDELEAAAIALAGMKLIKEGKIEGIRRESIQ